MANPRIHQIKDILKSTEYSGQDSDASLLKNTAQLLTLDQLLGEVQASKREIMSVLPSLGVTEINGKVRMISRISFRDVVRTLLDTILEHNWNLDNIDELECLRLNPGLDPVLLRALLGQLGTTVAGSGNSDEHTIASSSGSSSSGGSRTIGGITSTWELNYDRLARAAAEDMFIEHVSSSRQEVKFMSMNM